MSKRDILKRIAASLVTLLCLTALLVFIFRDNLGDIEEAFRALPALDVLWLFAMGASYQLLDAAACVMLVRTAVPDFSYRRALEVIYLGVFSKTSTLGAGTIPIQAYYLHRCGVETGRGVGTMTFSYVLHKTAVVLVASVFLLFGQGWLRSAIPGLHPYLIVGYVICLGIIVVLLLLCVWRKAHHFAAWSAGKLPDHGKWTERKQKLQQQLEYLYYGTASFLKNKRMVLMTLFAHIIKLLILYAVPYVCIQMLGGNPISLSQSELLTALIFLIAGALPNIAGIGPIEVGFLLLFSTLLGDAMTASSLLLFRIATYYFPFLVSAAVFLGVQNRALSMRKSEMQQKNKLG